MDTHMTEQFFWQNQYTHDGAILLESITREQKLNRLMQKTAEKESAGDGFIYNHLIINGIRE